MLSCAAGTNTASGSSAKRSATPPTIARTQSSAVRGRRWARSTTAPSSLRFMSSKISLDIAPSTIASRAGTSNATVQSSGQPRCSVPMPRWSCVATGMPATARSTSSGEKPAVASRSRAPSASTRCASGAVVMPCAETPTIVRVRRADVTARAWSVEISCVAMPDTGAGRFSGKRAAIATSARGASRRSRTRSAGSRASCSARRAAVPASTSRSTPVTMSSKRSAPALGRPRSGSTMQSMRAAKGCAERSLTPRRTTTSTPARPTRDSAGRTAGSGTVARPRLRRRGGDLELLVDVREPAAGHRHDALADVVGERVAPRRRALLGPFHDRVDQVARRLAVDQAAQAEADVPALVELDVVHALAHARHGAVVEVLEQGALAGGQHHALERHVVQRHPVAQVGAALLHRGGHRRQLLLEELDDPGRRDLARRGVALLLRLPRQLEHLGGDAVEEARVTLLVALLEEDHPSDQRVLGGGPERLEVHGDGVVGDPEAGQDLREPLAALVGHRAERLGVRGKVDALLVPLQLGHDAGEEVRPAVGGQDVPRNVLLAPSKSRRGIECVVPRLPLGHGRKIPIGIRVPARVAPGRPPQAFAWMPASLRITASDDAGPGQYSWTISGPPPRRIARSASATTTASSSCPATGMKSGTMSNGRAR